MAVPRLTGAGRRRSAGIAACLAGPVLLAGCTLAPPHVRPAHPVPSTYADQTSGASSIARIGWHDFFREDHLRALIAAAIENNRDIRIATARVAEARAAWRIEGTALYPELNAVGTG
ncbi:MAG: RND transporter, partial [Pseudomonadota bacterium]